MLLSVILQNPCQATSRSVTRRAIGHVRVAQSLVVISTPAWLASRFPIDQSAVVSLPVQSTIANRTPTQALKPNIREESFYSFTTKGSSSFA
jgi:hypothetical protein